MFILFFFLEPKRPWPGEIVSMVSFTWSKRFIYFEKITPSPPSVHPYPATGGIFKGEMTVRDDRGFTSHDLRSL